MHLSSDQEFVFHLFAQSYDFFFCHGTSNSGGVLTAVKQSKGVMAIKMANIPSKMLALDITCTDNTILCVINIYAPNNPGEHQFFFRTSHSFLLLIWFCWETLIP